MTQFRVTITLLLLKLSRDRRPQNIPETHRHFPLQRWNPYSGRGRGTIRRSVVACTPPVRTCRRERIGEVRHRSTLFVQVCTHKCHNFVYLWLGEPRNLAATTFRRCIYLLFVQRKVTGTTGVAGSGSKAVIYWGPKATGSVPG